MRMLPFITSLAIVTCGLMGVARGDDVRSENGRFSMAVVGDSVIRLDTRSGAVSRCAGQAKQQEQDWLCRILPDERSALDTEIGRLADENDALKAQLAQREADAVTRKSGDAMPKDVPQESLPQAATPKADALPRARDETPEFKIPLPSARDVDRVRSAFEQAWQALIAFAARLQRTPDRT